MTPDHFDFSHALALLKQGKRVARKGWEEWAELRWLRLRREQNGWYLLSTGMHGEDIPTSLLGAEHLLAEDWHEVTG